MIGYALGLALVAAAAPPTAGEPADLLLFYDPDANHQAIVNITSWFNTYLRDSGSGLSFQPVKDRAAFESLLGEPSTKFAIVSSAFLREGKEKGLSALLVPSSSGDVYYRKKLIDRGQGQLGDLSGANIAATVTDRSRGGEVVLESLRAAGIEIGSAHIIPVSKDIDALLALSFGQVQAALVTPSSVEVLKRINPAAVASFRTVLETKPILRSPLCSVTKNTTAEEREKITAAIKKMVEDENGRKATRTLGFDQWVPYEPRMLQK